MQAGNPIIRCENLTVGYGNEIVLRDLTLEIPRGMFLPFIGPNGAGKTTLLRAILGLVEPRRGRVVTPFADSPPAYVPQHRRIDPLYPVTLTEIVAMGLYPANGPWRKPDRDQRETMDAILADLGLAQHSTKTFGELSGGMKQKALLARAFMTRAEVLVLVEPTTELDVETEAEILEHLVRMNRTEGRTILFAHHGLDDATAAADTIAVVNHGEVRLVARSELTSFRAPVGVGEVHANG